MTTHFLFRYVHVDDDPTQHALIGSQIERLLPGAIPTYLDGVNSAIVHLSALPSAQKPDFIFTDLNMPPGSNGWAFAGWLQDSLYYRGTPVIMVTDQVSADPESAFQIHLERYGLAGYLQKPVTLEALEALLRRLLRAVSRPDIG